MKNLIMVFIVVLAATITVGAQETIFHQEMTWSPDGKYLSYTIFRKLDPKVNQIMSEIHTMKPDGSGSRKIADEARWTSWSRDGKRLLFSRSSADNTRADLFTIKLDGTGLVQLTKDAKRNSTPGYSPNGKSIVFSSTRDSEKYQIYAMKADGTGVKRLTTDANVGFFNPVWSPDGKKIVYYAEKGDQRDQIWIMNADGTNQKLITNNLGHNIFPGWSADGKRIVFSSSRRETNADGSPVEGSFLYVINDDGTNLTKLGNIKSSFARFSPDGKRLAFTVGGFPSNEIYVANADGSNPVKITSR